MAFALHLPQARPLPAPGPTAGVGGATKLVGGSAGLWSHLQLHMVGLSLDAPHAHIYIYIYAYYYVYIYMCILCIHMHVYNIVYIYYVIYIEREGSRYRYELYMYIAYDMICDI